MVTLADRTGPPGPEPGPDATRLVRRVHELFATPLDALTTEDLRLLLRQHVAPAVLLPYAVDLLARDPWAGGDMSDGALLEAVLAVPAATWPAGCADRLAARLSEPDARQVLAGPPPPWWERPADGPAADDLPDLGDAVRAAAGAFLAARSSVTS